MKLKSMEWWCWGWFAVVVFMICLLVESLYTNRLTAEIALECLKKNTALECTEAIKVIDGKPQTP